VAGGGSVSRAAVAESNFDRNARGRPPNMKAPSLFTKAPPSLAHHRLSKAKPSSPALRPAAAHPWTLTPGRFHRPESAADFHPWRGRSHTRARYPSGGSALPHINPRATRAKPNHMPINNSPKPHHSRGLRKSGCKSEINPHIAHHTSPRADAAEPRHLLRWLSVVSCQWSVVSCWLGSARPHPNSVSGVNRHWQLTT